MKQVLQSLMNGKTEVAEVPVPAVMRCQVLVKTSRTLISAGTERMLVEFGKAGWIEKARLQPEKVQMVLNKIKTDGLQATLESVFSKLDQPLQLGYCNVGRIAECGAGVTTFHNGDRVVSNGNHAEAVSVPVNLCARIPDNVSDEDAAFTVLGAIALQGIRLVGPTLGEAVVVTGLGLIGLLAVQLLRANGCRVLGLDYDPKKVALARQFGAEAIDLSSMQDALQAAERFSRGRGVDAVLVTAATKSSDPIHQAALMCRKRGRIVLVGVTGLELSREDFYKKELSFQVSSSYGPGRYDPAYEQKGQDYPFGFVRWTEQRNFEAVLDMMASGSLDVKPLISHSFAIEDAGKAYELVVSGAPSLGILMRYPGLEITSGTRRVVLESQPSRAILGQASVSFLGAGNYSTSVLIPAFKAAGARLRYVASTTGVSGVHAGRKFGFEETTTDVNRLIEDAGTDAVVITTRHNSHARYVLQALSAGKHVFVEKPLCLTRAELQQIEAAYQESKLQNSGPPIVTVGFNRRFAPLTQKVKGLLGSINGPKAFVMTVNAGSVPSDHWTQDAELGGGRIIGEACHFLDLLRYLAGAPISGWKRSAMDSSTQDTVTIQLSFQDGSIGTIHYFANGSKAFPKERLEVFASGMVLQLDNFRILKGYGWPGFSKQKLWKQDKGQKACAKHFMAAITGQASEPIPFQEIAEISQISIEIAEGIS